MTLKKEGKIWKLLRILTILFFIVVGIADIIGNEHFNSNVLAVLAKNLSILFGEI